MLATTELMFGLQRRLMLDYKEIEQLPHPPVALQTPNGQKIMKDFAWRIVEELVEAFEVFPVGLTLGEELADVTHFVVELLIFGGVDAERCVAYVSSFPTRPPTSYLPPTCWELVCAIGQAMNQLRWRPWKRQAPSVNEERFRLQLIVIWACVVDLWGACGFDEGQMLKAFEVKYGINQQRQQEGY